MTSAKINLAISPIGWTNDDPNSEVIYRLSSALAKWPWLVSPAAKEVGNKYPRDPIVLNEALVLRGLTI